MQYDICQLMGFLTKYLQYRQWYP